MLVRILVQVLAVALPILAAVLDYQWRDKRTKRFARTKWVTFAVGALLLAFSVHLTIRDDRSHAREVASLNRALESIQTEGRDRHEATQARLAELLQENRALQSRLAPFERLSDAMFSDSPPALRLSKLEGRLADLSLKTASIEDRVTPRSIRGDVNVFRSHLTSFAGEQVQIDAHAGDPEAVNFAYDILTCLREAGLAVTTRQPNVHYTPDIWKGLALAVPPGSRPGYAEALCESFRLAGYEVQRTDGPPPLVILRVGAR